MKRGIIGAALAVGCSSLFGDLDRVIGLELSGGVSRTIAVGDTLRLMVRAITASGDTLPDAEFVWAVLDTGLVAFALDTRTGTVVGLEVGAGRVQAVHAELRSDPITITVVALPPPSAAAGRDEP